MAPSDSSALAWLSNPDALEFEAHGAQVFRGALTTDLAELTAAIEPLDHGKAGLRIGSPGLLQPFLDVNGCIGAIATSVLGSAAKPLRAILFNKTEGTNWALGWHQDRTICVKNKCDVPGFGPWTVKGGMHHVAPPFELLARMVTVRAHIDHTPPGNAPLLIAPGSHRYGRIAVDMVDEIVRSCGSLACVAGAGDLWLYATPILHASDPSLSPTGRRVLQVAFAAEDLPGGLEWSGL